MNLETENEQLRTRLAEMAAEIERLQSVIDEANAQEPVYFWREIGEGDWMQCHKDWYYKCVDSAEHDTKMLYARPIPAQQSQADSELNFYGNVNVSEAISIVEQQSPAVTVPDIKQEYKLFCKFCDENPSLNLDPRLHTHSGQIESGGYIEQVIANVAFKAWRARAGVPSPRITEHDAKNDYDLRFEIYKKARDYVESYEKSSGYPPSVDVMFSNFTALLNLIHGHRITEQDALAIAESLEPFFDNITQSFDIPAWHGRVLWTLLDKLNGDKNAR